MTARHLSAATQPFFELKQFPKRTNGLNVVRVWVALFVFECPRLICGTV